jgi:hypothetical protein
MVADSSFVRPFDCSIEYKNGYQTSWSCSYQFFASNRDCPTWLRITSGVYYGLLKLASLIVYFGLPGWALWQAHRNVSLAGGPRYAFLIGGSLAAATLLQVLLSDTVYSAKVLWHLGQDPDAQKPSSRQ